MADFYDLVARRASCRSFLPDPIPEDVLRRILTAGCQSPNGGGFQTYSILCVQDPEKKKALARLSRNQGFIARAPMNLVFCIDFHRTEQVLRTEPAPFARTADCKELWMGLMDCAICAQTVVLAAEAEGLASCYIGNILNKLDQVTDLLELPDKVCPAIMLTIGYPRRRRKQPPRYPLELMVHRDRYHEPDDETVYQAYRRQNQYRKWAVRESSLASIEAMARKTGGEDLARRVLEDIREKGSLGPYQYWFGVYYTEDDEFLHYEDYARYFRDHGFTWLPGPEEDKA